MRALSVLRGEVRLLVPDMHDVLIRNSEIDRELNRAYRKIVKHGELLKTYITTDSVVNQSEYDLTSASIWTKRGDEAVSTPDILKIIRVDYDGYKTEPVDIEDVYDLSESFGGGWYIEGKYLGISNPSSVKEIKVHYVPGPTALSATSDTAETELEDYEDGLVYYAAFMKAEKQAAFNMEKFAPLATLYRNKWQQVLNESEDGGIQALGVKFTKVRHKDV